LPFICFLYLTFFGLNMDIPQFYTIVNIFAVSSRA